MMHNLKDFLETYEVDQTQSLDPKHQGSIYQATNKATETTWALKWAELHPRFDKGVLTNRYEKAQELSHLNLLPYHQNFRFEEGSTIVELALLPIVTRKSLAQATGLNTEEKYAITEQVLDGLYYLHGHGVIWQNLSASHILLEESFGNLIPKFINYGNQERIPLPFFSDYEYLAPEQFKTNSNVTEQTDIWAYGVLLHQLWTGRLPFGEKSASLPNAKIQARITGEEDWALGLLPTIPMPYRLLVEKCLKKNQEERWENCGQIIAALKKWENTPDKDILIAEKNVLEEEEKRERRFLRRPSRPINWWVVLILLGLAVALGRWLG
ncbi:MAG: protein kinase domain-containing protein [Aureispira sp.]